MPYYDTTTTETVTHQNGIVICDICGGEIRLEGYTLKGAKRVCSCDKCGKWLCSIHSVKVYSAKLQEDVCVCKDCLNQSTYAEYSIITYTSGGYGMGER